MDDKIFYGMTYGDVFEEVWGYTLTVGAINHTIFDLKTKSITAEGVIQATKKKIVEIVKQIEKRNEELDCFDDFSPSLVFATMQYCIQTVLFHGGKYRTCTLPTDLCDTARVEESFRIIDKFPDLILYRKDEVVCDLVELYGWYPPEWCRVKYLSRQVFKVVMAQLENYNSVRHYKPLGIEEKFVSKDVYDHVASYVEEIREIVEEFKAKPLSGSSIYSVEYKNKYPKRMVRELKICEEDLLALSSTSFGKLSWEFSERYGDYFDANFLYRQY